MKDEMITIFRLIALLVSLPVSLYAVLRSFRTLQQLTQQERFYRIRFLQHLPNITQLPLQRPKEWTEHKNEGKSPCDKRYPKITFKEIRDIDVFNSDKKGIW